MLSATFGDEIKGYEQRDSTGCDINDRVRFLGSGRDLLGLGLLSHLSELTLRRLLLGGLLGFVDEAADTHLNQAWEYRGCNLEDTSKNISETSKDTSKRESNAINPVRVAVRGSELITHRTWDMIVHRVAETVGDVLDVSHCSSSDQAVPISGSRYVLCTWVNEN